MFRTRSLSALYIFLLVASVFVGCGGANDSSSPSTPSPYAGHWKGTWVDSIWGQTGTLDITVAGIDNVTGSVVNQNVEDTSGAVSGVIGNNGRISWYYYYRWDSFRALGALSINASGHLVGNITEYDIYNLVARQDSVDMVKQ
jgi:CBS domain-containing protein